MVKVAVVVDSLSKLLLWQSPSEVCTFLHQLLSSSTGTGINEFIIFSIFGLLIFVLYRGSWVCAVVRVVYLRYPCTRIKSGLDV